MRKILLLLLLAAVLVLLVLFVYAKLPTATRAITASGSAERAELIERGRYVATASDCVACHTAPGGEEFAGGLPIASPIGTIYSTNITPDRKTGIGSYSLDDFDRAVRHGITPEGGTLYPAMPYPSYVRLTDADVEAMYTYFMQGVTPRESANRDVGIRWPLSMRWPLAIWRKQFGPDPDAAGQMQGGHADEEIARGAYLVQGPGHCGSCHTPRAITLQEKAMDESGADYLAGGQVIDGWLAVNLRGNKADGLGNWSRQDIIDVLKTGRSERHAVVGTPMADVVQHSTQHLTDADLGAIAAYLKSLPPSAGDPSSFAANPQTASELRAGINSTRGAELYVDNCAACHRSDAEGYARVFPSLAGNSTVLAADPTTLIHLVLEGSEMPSTVHAPSNLGMPGFADRLTDEDVAELGTFLRGSFGNKAPAVTARQVAGVRGDIRKMRSEHKEAAHDPTEVE
ncbi:cytochrome c [Stenotrophomonas tumulicola]|uniref:Cytochrome c n=1 Tax=Stenotrophomonas tumulicola TaxID=1685415 RepID=A0A7W3IGM5_9GAMM|nr:cytochrome c [Stenotrophomonas tumulicola]MBA8680917.1 cytochrome c [Stenotrophomonas tumulicola]